MVNAGRYDREDGKDSSVPDSASGLRRRDRDKLNA